MVINFENEMEGICIENYGNETITFITDEQLNTLKANQGFYDNLTPFNKLEIQTSQTYSGNISGYVLGRF
ncbi:hypothetical protein D7X33_47680 [Butyricicoccus sp. 1XD8-22]|nr:hypothetical protein D7X33_47680 [Butyricicoccus sp. 1XD8-22]